MNNLKILKTEDLNNDDERLQLAQSEYLEEPKKIYNRFVILLKNLVVALAVFLAAYLTLDKRALPGDIITVWGSAGVGVGLMLLWGYSIWPGIALGSLAFTLEAGGPDPIVLFGSSSANVIEAVSAVWFLQKFKFKTFSTVACVVQYFFIAGIFATSIAGLIGIASLCLSGRMEWNDFFSAWVTWTLSDMMGVLVISPAIVVWAKRSFTWNRVTFIKNLLPIALVSVIYCAVFGVLPGLREEHLPLTFVCAFSLLMSTFFLDLRGITLLVFITAVVSSWGASNGFGPFAEMPRAQGILLLQIFEALAAGIMLIAVALVTQKRNLREELKRSNADLERFAYVAAHDLQAPLRQISSFAQVLQKDLKGSGNEENLSSLEFIVEGATNMSSLIKDLLTYGRLSNSNGSFELIDLNILVSTALKNLRASILETGAMITVDSLPTIEGSSSHLSRLFQNLIENAMKYRRKDVRPKINISFARENSFLHFSVKDNGIGIQETHFKKLFELFQRLHSKSAYPGNGVGLSVCKRVVELHGGRIWVESKAGEGSVFHFTIRQDLEKA